jgi:hypothetical protein
VVRALEDCQSECRKTRQICLSVMKITACLNDCTLPERVVLPLKSVAVVNDIEEKMKNDTSVKMHLVCYCVYRKDMLATLNYKVLYCVRNCQHNYFFSVFCF